MSVVLATGLPPAEVRQLTGVELAAIAELKGGGRRR
jgi:hypothetical protein